MDSSESHDVAPADPSKNGGLVNGIVGLIEVFTDLPVELKRNVAKAVSHMMKVPAAWIDGKAGEIKANAEARVLITGATATSIARQIDVDPSVAQIAADTHASKILRQTVNTAKVLRVAAEEIKLPSPDGASGAVDEIQDDWLNAFEQEAVNMSSEHMQRLFGKILAGEIRRPTTFSIRTVKLMAQLDNKPAELFRKLCSLAIVIRIDGKVNDARVIAVGDKSPGDNGLIQYGLSYGGFNMLSEYGLVIADLDALMPYDFAVAEGGKVQLPVHYVGKPRAFKPLREMSSGEVKRFRLQGVALSQAGKELLSIVECEEDEAYSAALNEHLKKMGFSLVPVTMSSEI